MLTPLTNFDALKANTPDSEPNNFQNIKCEIGPWEPSPLQDKEVLIRAHYSSINYKDALAVTGKGKILRKLPLVPGIDVAGIVEASAHPDFSEGQKVLVTGCGLGENIHGGYARQVVAPGNDVIALPEGLSLKESMIFGTAGFTAALAIHQLELNGLKPEKGEVLVTGATGGVGCLSLQILKKLGYQTRAWTRKEDLCPWLLEIGATSAESIKDKDFQSRPLASAQWSAAIDNVGDNYLSFILPRIHLWGSVASIGLAKSPLLQTTVFPFILRGVNILGISSGNCPPELRAQIWSLLATTYKPKNLEYCLSAELKLSELSVYARSMVAGQTKGRALVRLTE